VNASVTARLTAYLPAIADTGRTIEDGTAVLLNSVPPLGTSMDVALPALKTAVAMSHRGFESLSLRQSLFEYEMAVYDLSKRFTGDVRAEWERL
jgi:hypothetical protein